MPYSYRMDSKVPYSAQYHRQHCTLQARTSEFQATTESNEPLGRPTAKDTRLSNAMAWALVQWLNLPA